MSLQVQGFRLSPPQRHIWMLQADSSLFRAQAAILLEGKLDSERLRRGLSEATRRHEILRTVYRRSPGMRFPIQVIVDEARPLWHVEDLSILGEDERTVQLDALFEREARTPIDLEQGPVVHACLAALGPDRHVLLLGLPSLCADARTLSNLAGELAEAYGRENGAAPEREVVQYLQFSEWQNELLESEEGAAGRDFWHRQNLTPTLGLELPADSHAAGDEFAFSPAAVAVPWREKTAVRLEEVASRAGVLPSYVLLTAWKVLLGRLGGGPATGVGVLYDGRQHEELQEALGLFARFLPVSCELEDNLRFTDAAARLANAVARLTEYQDFYAPEEAASPIACFEYEERRAIGAGEVSFSLLRRVADLERFKICLAAGRSDGTLTAEIRYDASRVSREFAAQLAERLARLLDRLLERPESFIGDIDVLTEAERWLLGEINRTETDAPHDCVHRLFEHQAARTPGHFAVELKGRRLTYAELEARANQLARHLLNAGVRPDRIVGICIDRSIEMVVAVLGVLKAGGAYLPLDPTYPAERLAFMMEEARPAALLTQGHLAARLPATDATVLRLDLDWQRVEREGTEAPDGGATLDNLAYVIYTSGSTGRPKGVMVPHRGLVNYLSWAVRTYGVEEGRPVPVHSPFGFDLTVTSLFAPLLAGGRVQLFDEERGIEALAEALRGEAGFSLVKLTPAHLNVLAQQLGEVDLAGKTGALILGGEALSGETLATWRERMPATRFINEYGPTETVVGCTMYEVPAEGDRTGPVPIGRPIANSRVYVLDRSLQLLPPATSGELYVGGIGVSRGYLGRPELTAERFVPDSLSGVEGSRLYRTGDVVRHLPSGDLEFLGRVDQQVKVRGYRVEPGEIEAVLTAHPAVREAAVVVREDVSGELRLVAYYVPAAEAAPGVEELRHFLSARLPDYMVPGAWLRLAALPLTTNGKVDRTALPQPSTERPELNQAYVAPRTPLEEVLVGIWEEVLGIDKVGIHDGFFALGGDSIRSVRVVALAKNRGLEFTIPDLFRHQTVAELAAHLEVAMGLAVPAHEAAAISTDAEEDADELARMVEELEGLSEEAVRARLREKLQGVDTGGSV